jgi:hypothetical protein
MAVDGRKDLIEYLPPIKQNIRELKGKFDGGLQPEIDNEWNTIRQRLDDTFASTASTYGIRKFEAIYGIVPKGSDTIEDRRFRILTRMNERIPYTWKRLLVMLDTLVGVNDWLIISDLPNYKLTVKLMLHSEDMINSLHDMLQRVLPANLIYEVEQKYNKYKELQPFTYANLSFYTYKQVREDTITIKGNPYSLLVTYTYGDLSAYSYNEVTTDNIF